MRGITPTSETPFLGQAGTVHNNGRNAVDTCLCCVTVCTHGGDSEHARSKDTPALFGLASSRMTQPLSGPPGQHKRRTQVVRGEECASAFDANQRKSSSRVLEQRSRRSPLAGLTGRMKPTLSLCTRHPEQFEHRRFVFFYCFIRRLSCGGK